MPLFRQFSQVSNVIKAGWHNPYVARGVVGAGIGGAAGALGDGRNRTAGFLGGAILGAGAGAGVARMMLAKGGVRSTAVHQMVGTVTDESYRRAVGMQLKSRMRMDRRGIVTNSGFAAFSRRYS